MIIKLCQQLIISQRVIATKGLLIKQRQTSLMQESFVTAQSILTIQVFYYSSPNHIFINTFLIQVFNQKYVPQNVRINLTQIPQPTHHNYGQAPFLCVNNSHIVKKQQIWEFLFSVLNIKPLRKYEFVSVAFLAQEISQVANIFTDYDQNPYYVFLSPWRKYKRHLSLQNKKHWFRDNSLFCSTTQDSLNKEHFIYKANSLGNLMEEYAKPNATEPDYLKIYKILIFALLKHLKIVQNTLYLVVSQVKALKDIENEVLAEIERAKENGGNQERIPVRNIPFMNVKLQYLEEKFIEKERADQNNVQIENPREKLHQSIFKPVITTLMFALAMLAFK